jgi:Tol biopolymer transport system component
MTITVLVSVLPGCKVTDPLYCDQDHPCTDPDRSFCDLDGTYPASDGVARTCIPEPSVGEMPDAGSDGGPGMPDSGPDEQDGAAKPDPGIQCPGLIAFRSERDGDSEIYVSEIDGSKQQNLTQSPDTGDADPAWSPDGTRVAFVRDFEIWVMNADGSEPRQLTAGPPEDFLDSKPVWAPDGARISFSRLNRTAKPVVSEIWVVDEAGGTPTSLMNAVTELGSHSWSPDGSQIAFVSSRDGNNEIYKMSSDGSGQTNLTNDSLDDGDVDDGPIWSPDGTELLFISRRMGSADIWIMGADGSDPRNLTNTQVDETQARLLPDGSSILFGQETSGEINDLFSMNADGSGQRNLTNDPEEDQDPAISPDGTKVAWSSYRDSNFEIYVTNADGTSPVRLTANEFTTDDDSPAWQPCK